MQAFKRFFPYIFYTFILGLAFLLPEVVSAADAVPDAFGTEFGASTGLGSDDIRLTIARIIRAAFGFLGVIALGLTLYGGFTYMTAGGDENKVTTAKKILVNSAIGLAIILSAFSISQFIISRLSDATGFNVEAALRERCSSPIYANEHPEICDDFGGFGGGGNNRDNCELNHFVVKSITPNTSETNINDVKIRALFSANIGSNDPASVLNITSSGVNINDQFEYQFLAGKSLVEASYIGDNMCGDSKCLAQGKYDIDVKPEVVDENGIALEIEPEDCEGLRFPERTNFVVNVDGTLDLEDPQISNLEVFNSAFPGLSQQPDQWLPRGKKYPILADISDNAGLAYTRLEVFEDGSPENAAVLYDGPSVDSSSDATEARPYKFDYDWRIASDAETMRRFIVRLTDYDIDGRQSQEETSFVVVGQNCDPLGNDERAGCPEEGGACEFDWQCPSRRCVDGSCMAGAPMILDIDPWDAAENSWITVSGDNFGDVPGKIQMALGTSENWVDLELADCAGASSWTDKYAVAVVPPNSKFPLASTSSIRIVKAGAGDNTDYMDVSSDNHGPKSGPNQGLFTKSETVRPGICGINPGQGFGGNEVNIIGKDFGAVKGPHNVQFGSIQATITEENKWSNSLIRALVPENMQTGRVPVKIVFDSGLQSNAVPFDILEKDSVAKPLLVNAEPAIITKKSLLTITGKGFGSATGIVYLASEAGVNCRTENCPKLDLVTEPIECSALSWSNTQIIAQIPENIDIGNYVVVVEHGQDIDSYTTDDIRITIEDGDPNIGICALTPKSGPAPLPEGHNGLEIVGLNLEGADEVYFWAADARNTRNIIDLENTWLSKILVPREFSAGNTKITTAIPVRNGISMPTGEGPIVVRNGESLSNPLYYTVSDCTSLDELPAGYQCCQTEQGRGIMQSEQIACPGEVREAGYMWRFASGKIPNPPRVLESCDYPSPSPSLLYEADSACLNASITVAFSTPMEEADFFDENNNISGIHVYTCGSGDRRECSYEEDIVNDFNLQSQSLGAEGHIIRLVPDSGMLEANTWYRVVLDTTLRSRVIEEVLGEENIVRQSLLATNPISDFPDSAYAFSFKTGAQDAGPNGDGLCEITSSHILPRNYTTELLGLIRYPRSSNDPLYYQVYGRGDQNCIDLSVDHFNWNWSVEDDHVDEDENSSLAEANKAASAEYQNSRATVDALGDTLARDIFVKAEARGETTSLEASSNLNISIAEPRVSYHEPECSASCINASIYVEFNMPMATSSYRNADGSHYTCEGLNCYSEGVRVYKCQDANCVGQEMIPPQNYQYSLIEDKAFAFDIGGNFEKDTNYLVKINGDDTGSRIRSLNKINPPVAGKFLPEYEWFFRTKNDATECALSDITLSPKEFLASSIGDKQVFRVSAYSSPNECSSRGQFMDPLQFGWVWSTGDSNIASVSTFNTFERNSKCSESCLPLGSTYLRDQETDALRLCGNGVLDAGEDCDIALDGEIAGKTCSLSCLRPGAGQGDTFCGNGVVDNPEENNTAAGELCDPGRDQNGIVRSDNPFCTNTCVFKGSRAFQDDREPRAVATDDSGTTIKESLCGDGDVSFGEVCEPGIGCNSSCLHIGTTLAASWCENSASREMKKSNECKASVSLCGNGIIENGEECEAGIGGATEATCNTRCLLQNVCGTPLAECQLGAPGCSNDCTYLGSSLDYGSPSLCGDGDLGIGESPLCEVSSEDFEDISPGSNPVQIVTAVGQGLGETQETKIFVNEAVLQNNILVPGELGDEADFALSCGFKEFGSN